MSSDKNFVPYISREEIQQICQKLGKTITEDFSDGDIHLVAVLKGAVVFVADLMRSIERPMKLDFVKLSSYGGGMESTGKIRIDLELSEDIKDKNVLVVEDILDTGQTLNFFIGELKKRGPKKIKVCTLLDKPSKRKVPFEADYVGRQIEDHFVVGYGLDYAEYYRNSPDILRVE